MTKQEFISREILKDVERGVELKDAFNEMLGEGEFERLASDIYDEFRARGEN